MNEVSYIDWCLANDASLSLGNDKARESGNVSGHRDFVYYTDTCFKTSWDMCA